MKFTIVYNKRAIMLNAHDLYRGGKNGDFAECLRKAWENAKEYKELAELVGEEVHTWYGWTLLGREVIHDEVSIGKIAVWDTLKNKAKRIKAYFKFNQTCELGTQPPKGV